ncbi:hypothetical protein N7522_002887 [Penicillium canescens]|nr:hypothetical protein N7522_002887 [Penicillium canescens]
MSKEQDHEGVPSISELDASLDAYWASHGRPILLMGNGSSDDVLAGRRLPFQSINGLNSHLLPNLYPIYPVRGHDVSDLRCNPFQGPGFTSHGVFTHRDELISAPSRRQSPILFENRHIHEAPSPSITDFDLPPSANGTPTPQPSTARRSRTSTPEVFVTFSDVAAHTAKCDEGNERNRDGMSRCNTCGWQICRACVNRRAGDRGHSSFGSMHIEEPSRRCRAGSTPRQGTLGSGSLQHTSAEARAAETLVKLGSASAPADGARARSGNVDSDGRPGALPFRGRERSRDEADVSWSDSEVTLSPGTERVSVSRRVDEPEVPIGEDGLPLQYQIARRNPERRARPSSRMAE